MSTKGISFIPVKQYVARLKPALLYLFAGVLLLFAQKSVAFSENSVKEPWLQKGIGCSTLSLYAANHSPFESATIPYGHEITDENEQEDDYDYDRDFAGEPQALFNLFDFSGVTNLLPPSLSAVDNQATIPFFILYHSWKSFIA